MAQDGPSALETARQEKPDFILLDIMLPIMDGYRVCKMLKMDRRYKDMKVVFFSSKVSAEAMSLATAAGGDGYITKDVGFAKIVALIKEMTGVS